MTAIMTSPAVALLVKATLLLALGLLVAARIRPSAHELRHMVLLATIGATLALPFALIAAPHWDAPLLPSAVASPAMLTTTVDASDAAPTPTVILSSPEAIASETSTASVMRLALDHPATTLASIWLAGAFGAILLLALGYLRLHRITQRAWPLRFTEWTTLLDSERARARVAKNVALLVSPVASTPLTWGSRDAVILLPEDALDWPEDHRRVVLRHELAHIARHDAFAQLLAGVACALYWFHPLVWVASRRMRAECERACDDRVLSSGTPAAEYAAHLLEVARSSRSLGGPGFLSVAMARPSQLEGRLLSILDESRRHVALSNRARVAAIVFAAATVLAVSGFRAVPRAASLVVVPSTPAVVSTASVASVPTLAIVREKASRDTTFEKSVDVRSGGTLLLDLEPTGAGVTITGWDEPRVRVRGTLGGSDWRDTEVRLDAMDDGARLETRYIGRSRSNTFSHRFEIQVPRHFNVRVKSAGGSITIANVDGNFRGSTGGGGINIDRSSGDVRLSTGGGDIRVSSSDLRGTVSTGGGAVRITNVTGGLVGSSGSGDVTINGNQGAGIGAGRGIGRGRSPDGISVGTGGSVSVGSGDGVSISSRGRSFSSSSNTTTIMSSDDNDADAHFGGNGIRRSRAGGDIILDEAPDGARVTTGGGVIIVGKSAGEVYASTGGGRIDIGPAAGSVVASTGAGDISVKFSGGGAHAGDLWTGQGRIELTLPRDISATVILETAYTDNLGRKTRIESDWPLKLSEPEEWDTSVGTARRYVRSRLVLGSGEGTIRVRAINGDIILKRAP